MMIELKDSGSRSEFETGAVRDCQEGKGRMDLLPLHALMEISKIYEAGCQKYGDRNWEKGIPLSRFLDSGLRHIAKWACGHTDEPHLYQANWNFLCLASTVLDIEAGRLPYSLSDLPRATVAKPAEQVVIEYEGGELACRQLRPFRSAEEASRWNAVPPKPAPADDDF